MKVIFCTDPLNNKKVDMLDNADLYEFIIGLERVWYNEIFVKP